MLYTELFLLKAIKTDLNANQTPEIQQLVSSEDQVTITCDETECLWPIQNMGIWIPQFLVVYLRASKKASELLNSNLQIQILHPEQPDSHTQR